jgi:hypothetical protein
MTNHDDLLKALDAALQVEPSRAFADGVRSRVNQSRINTTRMWWGLAAAASIGFATMTLWRPSPLAPANGEPAQVAVATTPPAAPMIPSKAPVTVTGRKAPVARAAVATIASEPRLEVITNQRALLRELWAGVGSRAAVETALEVTAALPAAEVKPLTPIVLDPIVVTPIVMNQIGREPGREGAAPVIRRVDATKETK